MAIAHVFLPVRRCRFLCCQTGGRADLPPERHEPIGTCPGGHIPDEAILGLTVHIVVARIDNDPVPGVRAGSRLFDGMEAELLPVDLAPFKALADGWASLVSALIRIGLPVVGPGR